MSLNEKYLDELLKSVTTEEKVENKPVSDENTEQNQIKVNDFDNGQDTQFMQENTHAFSEDDLTGMLEHLEEIEASSPDHFSGLPANEKNDTDNINEEAHTEGVLKTEYDEEENGEAKTMAESAEYMSDIDELLKELEESSNENVEKSIQKPQSLETEPYEPSTIMEDGLLEESSDEAEEVDVMSLLDDLDENSDLAEIGDLLQKDENNEEIDNDDMMAMLERAAALEDEYQNQIADKLVQSIDSDEVIEEKKKKGLFSFKKKMREKEEGNNTVPDNLEEEILEGNRGKSKTIFSKLLDIFFEEEEVSEEFIPDVGEEGASDENLAILQELDKEKSVNTKKKKRNQKKKKSLRNLKNL